MEASAQSVLKCTNVVHFGLVKEPEPEKGKNCFHAIAPVDFLPLRIGTAMVTDRHFINPYAFLRHFHGKFWFEAKAIGFESDIVEDFSPKRFVAGLHI